MLHPRALSVASWLAALMIWAAASATAQLQNSTNISTPSDYSIVQRGPHSRIWQRNVLKTNNLSGVVTTNTQSYTELATGLCYMLPNGQYVDSVEQIVAVPGGAQATQGRYQVQWAANANSSGGSVTLSTPDGKQMQSGVSMLTYFDQATSSNVMLAQLQDSTGTIVGANQLIYSNAFNNVTADIAYTYRKSGMTQDIIVRQNLPAPSTYGLNNASTYLGVMTQFYNSPTPAVTAVTNNGVTDDRLLNFGDMRMGPGNAFLTQSNAQASPNLHVLKTWTNIDNQTFLIEEVPYTAVSNSLSTLQSSAIKPDKSKVRRTVLLDPNKSRNTSTSITNQVKVAKLKAQETGLVLDYVIMSPAGAPYTFKGSTTYLISDYCYIISPATFEGGTVIKYTNNSTAQIEVFNYPVYCLTWPYGPAVFTSMNDDSVGQQINGSTGNPSGDYAGEVALNLYEPPSDSTNLSGLRFSHLAVALQWTESPNLTTYLSDFQILDCQTAVNPSTGGEFIVMYNGLIYNIAGQVFVNFPWEFPEDGVWNLNGENLTIHNCADFDPSTWGSISLTNSMIVDVTNFETEDGPFTDHCTVLDSDAGVFQTVGAASHYLATGSTNQGAGTTNIDPFLLTDLAAKTTYPPNTNFVPSGGNLSVWLTNNYTFSNQVPRDSNGTAVDIGYHYDSLDYAIGGLFVSNANVTVLPGTVLATAWPTFGVCLYSTATWNCVGTATDLNYIVHYNTVQEQSNTNWNGGGTLDPWSWKYSFYPTPFDGTPVSAVFRFTEWSVLEGAGQMSAEGGPAVYLQDCQFHNGYVRELGQTLLSTNCLYQRLALDLDNSYGSNISNSFCNNLFLEGSVTFTNGDLGTTFQNNLFDQTPLYLNDTLSIQNCSNNAYVTTNFGVVLPENNDQTLSGEPAWETGTLGEYYYPASQTNLIYKGSQFASAAGLYHYTTTTNNVIDGTNMVTIGFHYVATDANGNPLDSTGDGLPDYVKDSNGDGVYDAGDVANWLDPFNIYDAGTTFLGWTAANERLSYWRFNTTNYTNEAGLAPQQNTLVTNVPDWSGQALVVNDTGSWLEYPITDANGPVFSPGNGTVRLWYMPYHDSGSFTGIAASFLVCSDLWGFGMAASNIYNMGVAVINDGYVSSFFPQGSPILQFQSNHWYQLTMTYTPTNFAIYTNGFVFIIGDIPPSTSSGYDWAAGDGLFSFPSVGTLGTLAIGNNDAAGSSAPAQGLIDEVETFNYALSPQAIAAGFPTFAATPTNNVTSDSNYVGVSDMLQEYVYGTSNVQTRLGYWRFDNPFLFSEQGQLPLAASNVSLVPGWSGTALNVGSSSSSGITYADVGTNGWANFNCRQGCLRFWFKPNPSASGTVPFVYMGSPSGTDTWTLEWNVTANNILFVTPHETNLQTNYTFSTTNWAQIVLDYGPTNGTPTNSFLYINGTLAASGSPVTNWPSTNDRSQYGLVIGNNTAYNSSINGQFDEIETFNYQLDPGSIWTNFALVQSVDSDLNGIPDLLEDIVLSSNRPFLGHSVVITGTIEAEQFDMGGPGIGYYTSAANPPSSYRPTKMLISPCDDLGGGYCLDQTVSNDWTQYTINVLVPQTYMVETRVAGIGTNGAFAISFATNGVNYTNTGPISITSTNWTNLSTVVSLNAGTNVMTLLMLTNANTNGIFGSNVGRFNYISIYPWWTNTGPGSYTTNIPTSLFSLGTNWSDGTNNASVIQGAINSLPSTGGTVSIPAGTYYVAQASPNETFDSYQNAAVYILTNNVAIAGNGKTSTTLIGCNRATTVFCLGQDAAGHNPQCTNFTIRDITITGQPHLAVVGLSGANVTNDPNNFIANEPDDQNTNVLVGQTTGSSTVFYGPYPAGSYDILITNCQFLYGNNGMNIYGTTVTDVLVRDCDFIMWDNVNSNFGNVGFFAQGENIVVLENTFNGNTTLTPTTNQPIGYVGTNQIEALAPAGLVNFQYGGNFFAARNAISNYFYEGILTEGGPASVVGNTYYSLINGGASCALAIASAEPGATGTIADYSTCFIGNLVFGGRTGVKSAEGNYLFNYNCSGNTFALLPAFDTVFDDYPGAMANVDTCGFASVCGNTLTFGGIGIGMYNSSASALILNNNLANVTYQGFGYYKDAFYSSISSVQLFGNTLGQGSTYHVELPFVNTSGWFLNGNVFLNAASNSVPPFLYPASSSVHLN